MPRKRNANGAGSIRQRKDGRWEARITIGFDPGTGKQKSRSFYGWTQKEVRMKMNAAIAELDQGTYQPPQRMKLSTWLDRWLSECNPQLRPSTREHYAINIRKHVNPALGNVQLLQLDYVTIQAFVNNLTTEKGLKPITVLGIFTVLRSALDEAVRAGYIPSNPATLCKLPKKEQAEITPLDAPDLEKLFSVLGTDVYSDIIRLAVLTGMRESEVIGMTWPCVDEAAGTLEVKQQLHRFSYKDPGNIFGPTKTGKPRTIDVTRHVIDLVRAIRIRQAKQRLKAGPMYDVRFDEYDLMFRTDEGRPISNSTLLHKFQQFCEAAGLPKHRFHDLRHTFACLSLLAGVDPKTVSAGLGHATTGFTLDRYGHVTDTMRKKSVALREAFFDTLNLKTE